MALKAGLVAGDTAPGEHREPMNARVLYTQLCAVSVLWGGTFVAGRYLGGGVDPLVAATCRFFLASAALFCYLLVTRKTFTVPDARQLAQLAMLGFFGIFTYNLCFFYGLTLTTASRASLIVCLNPAMIALASCVFYRERLNPLQLLGILLCILGAGFVIVSRNDAALAGSLSGDVVILGCVVSWVVYSVFSRNLSQALGPMLTVTYSIWLGTMMLAVACLAARHDGLFDSLAAISGREWGSLLYLGVAGSAVAYIWYYDAIRRIGPTRSGVFIALNPMTAVLFGVLLFGERLTPLICCGGALAILGIYLCNARRR